MTDSRDYKFVGGTCQKKDIYQLICEELVKAGWENISSNHCTDWCVFTSNIEGNGKTTKKLFLQLRDTNAADQNSVQCTNYCQMSYRLFDNYTPGDNGASGKSGRSTLSWNDLYIAPVGDKREIEMDTTVNYKLYVDNTKIIMGLEYPEGTEYQPLLFYIGQPDTTYVSESESRGMVVAVSCNAPAAGCVTVSNTPDVKGKVSQPYPVPSMALIPASNPNNEGKYFISDIYYGSAVDPGKASGGAGGAAGAAKAAGTPVSEGIRGKLDGLYCMLSKPSVLTGDIIEIGDKQYYVLNCHKQGDSSFGSQALLVCIA